MENKILIGTLTECHADHLIISGVKIEVTERASVDPPESEHPRIRHPVEDADPPNFFRWLSCGCERRGERSNHNESSETKNPCPGRHGALLCHVGRSRSTTKAVPRASSTATTMRISSVCTPRAIKSRAGLARLALEFPGAAGR